MSTVIFVSKRPGKPDYGWRKFERRKMPLRAVLCLNTTLESNTRQCSILPLIDFYKSTSSTPSSHCLSHEHICYVRIKTGVNLDYGSAHSLLPANAIAPVNLVPTLPWE